MGYFDEKKVSNSSMSSINPEQGGSPGAYKRFLEGDKEEEKSLSLERGRLLHLWAEDQEKFIISDIEKPTNNICKIIETVYEAGIVDLNSEEFKTVVLDIAEEINYGQSWNPHTLMVKVSMGGGEYLDYLRNSEGKIAVTLKTKEILQGGMRSIRDNKKVREIMFPQDTENFYKELPVYWNEQRDVIVNGKEETVDMELKALLDNLRIDPINKVAYLTDLKTTGFSAYNFAKSFRKYRYYRQMSHYLEAVCQYLIQQGLMPSPMDWTFIIKMVVVETNPPFNCVLYDLYDHSKARTHYYGWIDEGQKELTKLLYRIAFHQHTGNWEQSREEIEGNGEIELKYEPL